MSNKEEPLQTLDLAALSTVTGGTTTTDQDLMTALSSIVTSLQGLGTQQSSSMNPQTMMMMMMMMEQRNQTPVVAQTPYYPTVPGGGWYY